MKYIYLASAFFCLLAWLLPNHYQPWLSFYQDTSMFVATLILSSTFLVYEKIKIPYISFFLLIIACIPFIQYLLNIIYYLGDAIIISVYLLGFFSVFVGGYNIGELKDDNKEKIIQTFIILILIASIISVWIQLHQWLMFSGSIWIVDLPPNGRPFANMGQPNQLATLIIMGEISLLYLYEKSKINSVVAIFSAFFLLFGVALTQSRTSWVFLLCFCLWWIIKSKSITLRLHPAYLVFWIFIFLSFWIYLPYISNFLGVSNLQTVSDRVTTGLDRLGQWKQIILIIKESPFWGYGWGQLNVAQLTNETKLLKYPIFGFSHNLLLDLIVWNGIFIGCILISVISIFIIKLIFEKKDKESIVIISMVGALLVHSFFEYPFAYAYFLFPLGFLLGVLSSGVFNYFYLSRNCYFVYLSLCLILFAILISDYKEVESKHELMRYENAKLRNVDLINVGSDFILFDQLNDYIWFVRQPIGSTKNNMELERMRKVAYRFPDRPLIYKYLKILYVNGRHYEAAHVLKLYNAFYKQNLSLNDIKNKL